MPDLFKDAIVNLVDLPVTMNRFALEFHVTDSKNQQSTLLTHRGAGRLVWPDVLATLTAPQRRRVIEQAIEAVIAIKLEGLV